MTSVAFHVDQLFFKAPGGIGTYVRELAPALLRQDPSLDLKLFHSRFVVAGPPERWLRDHWVEELGDQITTLYPRWDLFGRPALPESLRSADVLHATNPSAIPPAAGRQRLVVTVHDLAFEHFPELFPRRWRLLYRLGLRAAVRRADAILTPSRSTAEDLVSRTKVRPERVHVVPLAAALGDHAADPIPVRERLKVPEPYALFVGTLEPRKNLVSLVRAYRRVAGAGLPHALVLAGPMGWQPAALLRELALPGPGEVVLTGPVSPADLDVLYRGASVFAYPSIYEGFGLPVLEALGRGAPTIASNASSVPEVVGDAGILVDPRSVAELADALERVLTDEQLASELSRKGIERAARFTWDETARRTLQVYDKAIDV
ncbi:MAG: glycosyltransferase family 1 protein [Actinomycetota bacterium]